MTMYRVIRDMYRLFTYEREERGAILPLAAIFATTVLLAAAIAIELHALNAAKEQSQQYTRMAVLAGSGAYVEALQNGSATTHLEAMTAAVTHINDLSTLNKLILNPNSASASVKADGVDTGAPADFIAGWWVRNNALCVSLGLAFDCPTNDDAYPAFRSWEEAGGASLPAETRPNAFKVEGDFFPDGYLVRLLNTVLGDQVLLNASATASYTPRWITFLVDLSPSVASDTHRNWTYKGPIDRNEPTDSDGNGGDGPFCCPSIVNGHGNRMAYITIEDNCHFDDPTALANNCPYNSPQTYGTGSTGAATTFGCENGLNAGSGGGCLGPPGMFDIELEPIDREWHFMNDPDPDDEFPGSPHHSYQLPAGSAPRNLRERWTTTIPAPDGSSPDWYHFADDYIRRYVVGDCDYEDLKTFSIANPGSPTGIDTELHHEPNGVDCPGGSAGDGTDPYYNAGPGFLAEVDYWRGGDYEGPQPLTQILQGIGDAITKLQNERVPGDAVSLIAFDNTVDWRTSVKLDPRSVDYLAGLLDLQVPVELHSGGEPDDDDISTPNSIATSGIGEKYDRLARLGLFPKRFVFTNLQLALQKAGEELRTQRELTNIPASEHIVIFTDGLHNCPTEETCGNNAANWQGARTNLLNYVSRIQTQNPGNDEEIGIPSSQIHWIVFGEQVGPHTKQIINDSPSNRFSPSGNVDECMTDEEFRSQAIDTNDELFIVSGEETNEAFIDALSGGTPFFAALEPLYQTAATSNGLFAPIRPRAASCLGTGGILEQTINENPGEVGCGISPTGEDVGVRCEDGDPVSFNPSQAHPLCQNTLLDNPPTAAGSPNDPGVPGNRLLVDPYCRDQTQQISDYLDNIASSNPFNIVSVD